MSPLLVRFFARNSSAIDVEVVGEADNGETALLQISTLKPDLVFLDIQMPVMGGFELLNHLTGGLMPAVIMVTAFDQHAVRAFEAGAVDYLLKPVSQTRLQQALERARLQRNPRGRREHCAIAASRVHRFVLSIRVSARLLARRAKSTFC